MGDDLTSLLDRVRALAVEEANGSPEALLGRIEHTLADGYAQALALEGERLRVQKEIDAVVARLPDGEDVARLAALAGRRDATGRDLAGLRELLDVLRRRRESVRRSPTVRPASDETPPDRVDGGLDPVLDL